MGLIPWSILIRFITTIWLLVVVYYHVHWSIVLCLFSIFISIELITYRLNHVQKSLLELLKILNK